MKVLPRGWDADKAATHALVAVGILRPGERPSASLRKHVGELMERFDSIDEVIEELAEGLLPRYAIPQDAEPDEELTLP